MEDETSGDYPTSFSSCGKGVRGCPAGCRYCFDDETCQQRMAERRTGHARFSALATKIGCEECGPDAFCHTDSDEVFCCNDEDTCLGSCYDFAEAFRINALWGTPVKGAGPVAAMTCNVSAPAAQRKHMFYFQACAEGFYELWRDPPFGLECVPCSGEDTKSKKHPHGGARHGSVCMAKTKDASKCQGLPDAFNEKNRLFFPGQSLYVKDTNSCHFECPYGTSQSGGLAASFKDIGSRNASSECLPCDVKYEKTTNDLAPSCMHGKRDSDSSNIDPAPKYFLRTVFLKPFFDTN